MPHSRKHFAWGSFSFGHPGFHRRHHRHHHWSSEPLPLILAICKKDRIQIFSVLSQIHSQLLATAEGLRLVSPLIHLCFCRRSCDGHDVLAHFEANFVRQSSSFTCWMDISRQLDRLRFNGRLTPCPLHCVQGERNNVTGKMLSIQKTHAPDRRSILMLHDG